MKKLGYLSAVTAGLLVSTEAVADPIDNPDLAAFIWYEGTGAPFLEFASGEDVSSSSSTQPASFFRADVDSDGVITSFDDAFMQYYPTSLSLTSNVQVKLEIFDVDGTVDCTNSATGTECEVDWDIVAAAYFDNAGAGPIVETDCKTTTFTISVAGNWDDTVSSDFTIPALSGSGHGYCGGYSSILNLWFSLGSTGANLSLYKFISETAGGGPLVGSP